MQCTCDAKPIGHVDALCVSKKCELHIDHIWLTAADACPQGNTTDTQIPNSVPTVRTQRTDLGCGDGYGLMECMYREELLVHGIAFEVICTCGKF